METRLLGSWALWVVGCVCGGVVGQVIASDRPPQKSAVQKDNTTIQPLQPGNTTPARWKCWSHVNGGRELQATGPQPNKCNGVHQKPGGVDLVKSTFTTEYFPAVSERLTESRLFCSESLWYIPSTHKPCRRRHEPASHHPQGSAGFRRVSLAGSPCRWREDYIMAPNSRYFEC